MKKMRLFIMSIFILAIGSFLVACNFKKPEAIFDKKEIAISIDETINLDEYLSVREIEKKDVVYKLENPNLFEFNGKDLTAKKSGNSYVHATYKKNILASMQIVVKARFTSPTFSNEPLSSNGVFSWNPVHEYYGDKLISAEQYRVEGLCTVYSVADPSIVTETFEIDETVSSNSFTLSKSGIYNLTVIALGNDYFDRSEPSQKITLSYGYVAAATNFAWDSEEGLLSWDGAVGAKFGIKFDGVELSQRQDGNSINLTDRLNLASAGEHTVSVISYDPQGTLIATESKTISITKLELPTMQYDYNSQNGGRVKIAPSQNSKGVFLEFENVKTGLEKCTLFVENDGQATFESFDELDAGQYIVKAYSTAKEEGLYFRSNELNFGNIYKLPTATIEGGGGNEFDQANFSINLSSVANPVDVLIKVDVEGDKTSYFEGYLAGQTNFEFAVELSKVGYNSVSLKQIPISGNNQIFAQDVYVINSNASESLVATKVDAIYGEISHAYVGENSVLTFAMTEFGTKYKLQIEDETGYIDVPNNKYIVNQTENEVQIVLNGKLEDDSSYKVKTIGDRDFYNLRVVATTLDEILSIGSTKTKIIESLRAPQDNGSGNSDNKTFSWGEVEAAGSYRVELYSIQKEVFDRNNGASKIDIDVSSLEDIGKVVENGNSINVPEVGYYYIRVYSISGSENSYISSKDALEKVFYVCEKLEIENIEFGEKNGNYFISIANKENVSSYDVFLNETLIGSPAVSEKDMTEFLISNKFESSGVEYRIAVVAHSENEEIYNESVRHELVIERLPKVVRGDITISDLSLQANASDLSAKTVSQQLSVTAVSGASGVRIWDGNGTTAGSETEKSARLSIASKSSFELNFRYYGAAKTGDLFDKSVDKIYLSGEISTFNFNRLQTPKNLAYYAGKLRFDHTGTTSKDYYILTLVCVGLNGSAENITVKLAKNSVAEYKGVSYSIGNDTDFVEINSSVVMIDFEKIIEEIQKIASFANLYNQSEKVGFALHAFQDRTDTNIVTICSGFASTNIDNTKIVCVVEKMPETTLEIDLASSETDYILTWSAVHANPSYESETKYQVMINGEAEGETISALSKSFSRTEFEDSTYYEFSVLAQNPYYVQSDSSNIIRIRKLASVSALKLFEDGQLGYDIGATERDFVDCVKVFFESSESENKNGKFEISEDGKLSLQVIGKKAIVGEGNKKTYYIDSDLSEWTVANMSNLKPADETVLYQNNTISWSAFGAGENLQALRYVLMFVDENGNKATYKTKATSENLTTNIDLYNSINALSGEVRIYVSAYLETFPVSGVATDETTYTVLAGKTIFYSNAVTLPTGVNKSNYYVYESVATVNKFETPNITNVQFISTDLSDAQLPTLMVEFEGNYGASRRFNIYLNGEFYKVETISLADGKYSFELAVEDYNTKVPVGGTLTIGVCALSETDILSSIGSVEVIRAQELGMVEFVKDASNELTHNIRIQLPNSHTDGGIVVKITYQIVGQEESSDFILVPVNELLNELTYDLSAVLNKSVDGRKILLDGGSVKISAYVGSFSGSGKFILSCPNLTESEPYQILKAVDEVTKTSGGFVIDANTNALDTIYIVECNGTIFEINYQNERFYFEFPHGGQWANGTYKLTIYAKQGGFLPSVTTEIDFALNKLEQISDIKVLRDPDDLSAITFSWNEVSGATGYVFRMYEAGDVERSNLLYDYTEERMISLKVVNSCTLTDIFGEGYQKLLDYGKLDFFSLMTDKNVFFDVFVRGTEDVNDSDIYTFDATIKGNSIENSGERTDVYVNEYGLINFNCVAGQTYLYRFVASDGSVLQTWTKLVATSDQEKIDTSKITQMGGTYFNMEIIVVGKNLAEEISTKAEGLVVDSISFTTYGSGTTFVVGTDIVDVGYIESEANTDLSFELVAGSYTKLFVGLDEKALIEGRVVDIVPVHIGIGGNNSQEICSYALSAIVDKLKALDQHLSANNSDITLYFWAYKETGFDDRENSYAISHFTTCNFTYTNQIDFVEIKKLGKELSDTSRYMEDYANTFALFENNDEKENKRTFGIYIKITIVSADESEETESLSTTLYVDKQALLSASYFHDDSLFVLNLTEVFESSEFAGLYGKFKFEFSTLAVKAVEGGTQFVLSDWISNGNGREFIFDKLRAPEGVELNTGNISWINSEEAAQKYYVYFIEDLTADGKMTDRFVYTSVQTNKYVSSYNVSDFVGLGKGYYLAVRGVNEDPYVLPSQIKFVQSGLEPVKVVKNEIKSQLKIENGKIFIPFVEGEDEELKEGGLDFVNYVKTCAESTDAAEKLLDTTFRYPFTFRLADLVGGQVKIRFRFTSLASLAVGKSQTFDIDARQLITSIFDIDDGYDYLAKLERLSNRVDVTTISNFINIMKEGSFGIGNYKTLFDDRFESLQSGQYKLDYCLLGNSSTLTSGWNSYSNNAENSLYVNNEPLVTAIKTTGIRGFSSANAYRIRLKKSEIFSKDEGVLSSALADRFVMKLYSETGKTYAFSIAKTSTSFSLTMLDAGDGISVTVYEVDAFGGEMPDGDYLEFYLNQNDGNSLLGRYGDKLEKVKYTMQIFAVGNNYSLSSKSSVFNLTLYGFGKDFTLNNGEFSWTANRNTKTTVVYKKHTSSDETVIPEPIDTISAKYSLDDTGNAGYGLYDYVDFLVVGDVYGNNIFVDSEVYHVENVYKLAPPTLSNTNGLIEINDTENAVLEGLDGCYSDLSLYNYKVSNDVARLYNDTASEFIHFTDEANAQVPIYYEVGTTKVPQTSSDYSYKTTELSASTFFVSSIGSSATFDIVDEEDPANYYRKTLKFKNSNASEFEDGSVIGVAVRSNYSTIAAKMIDTTSGISIKDGVLTWNSVVGRVADGLTISENQKIVYKVSIYQYNISYTQAGEVENQVNDTLEYFTLETDFDFARIDEEKLDKTAKYMKATVQAFAMFTSSVVPPFPTYIQLVEGGYAYGNVKYENTDTYVLMGDGDTIRAIERSQSVDEGSLQVVDGKLTWTVTFDAPESATEGFENKYKFSVIDESFKEIQGSFTFEQGLTENQVRVKFAEDKAQLMPKTQILSIYTTKISAENNTIKSFGREIEVEKLKTIDTDDYVISSDEKNSNIEVLDLTEYFALNPSNQIELLIYQNSDKSDTPSTILFGASRSKLFILGQEDTTITGTETGYAGKFVVGQDNKLILNFFVKNARLANCLYSDVSDDIILQRSSWGNGQITWDENSQIFEWTYDGFYALNSRLTATEVVKAHQTNTNAELFLDEQLSVPVLTGDGTFTIEEGTEILVESVYANSSRILYNTNMYYISNDNYEEVVKVVGEETLHAGSLFKIAEKYSETQTIISLESGKLFMIDANAIIQPVYIVEATYGEGATRIVRTYTTTEKKFAPTIIGKVSIKVKIKLGESNIQSQALEYVGGVVNFNLFRAGQGTSQNPFLISNEAEFKNISYRLSKDKVLSKYVESGNVKTEDEKYYFSILNDITFSSALRGILFNGVFTGEIRGNGHVIEYENSMTSSLTNGSVTISEGNVVSSSASTSAVISSGAALFETLASSAVVKDIDLKVSLKISSQVAFISRDSLISGLVITNSGKIENVNLIEFSSDFVGFIDTTSRIMMIYSGIASINTGMDALITGCSVKTNMEFNDFNTAQLVFVGGIAFTNYATIDGCFVGDSQYNTRMAFVGLNESDIVQIAGIVVTNASNATLSNCTNYANISVFAQSGNENFVVYMAGITDLAKGTVQDNQNFGTLSATNILDRNLHKGEISAKEAY